MIVLTTATPDARSTAIDVTAAAGVAALTLPDGRNDAVAAALARPRRAACPPSWLSSPSVMAAERPDALLRCRSRRRHMWVDRTVHERCCERGYLLDRAYGPEAGPRRWDLQGTRS